jgi:hypothetical protein
MLIIVITTCLTDTQSAVRTAQYARCIGRILELAPAGAGANSKIVIVEGNGPRPTSLDVFAERAQIVYTHNNQLGLKNKGHPELLDVFAALDAARAAPEDFVIKVTGRYYIEDESRMFAALLQCDAAGVSSCVKFGSFLAPKDSVVCDCVTGLIGMRAALIKGIPTPRENECVEWLWASRALSAPGFGAWQGPMGLSLCPGGDDYFSI